MHYDGTAPEGLTIEIMGMGPSTETEPKPSNRRPRKLTSRSDSLPRVGPLAHRIERSCGVL